MKHILVALILLPTLSNAQMTKQDSVWLPFKNMIGKWAGTSEGQLGKGKYERSYEIILNKKFIEVKKSRVTHPLKSTPKAKCMKTRAS